MTHQPAPPPRPDPEQLAPLLDRLAKGVGVTGLALYAGLALLTLFPLGPGPLVALLSDLGINIASNLIYDLYQKLQNLPDQDQAERLKLLATTLEGHLSQDLTLRYACSQLLQTTDTLAIAEEIVRGNPALHGWLLTDIRHTQKRVRQLLKEQAQTLRRIDEATQETLDWVREQQPAAQPTIPLDRPPRAEHQHFLGRQAELDRLLADLQPGQIITLCGPGGIGKTALADALIRALEDTGQLLQRFPDGVLFHTFYGQPDPALAFQYLVRRYDPQAQDTSAAAARGLLAHKRALIILDGTEATTRADLQTVINVTGSCAVLITTRRSSDAPTADRLDLAPLPRDEAITLLQTWAAAQINRETARAICRLLGRLPLALRLAGRYLRNTAQTPAEYLAWLQTTPLDALDHGQRRLESVPHLLERSLNQVSEEAGQLLALLGLLALAPFQPIILAPALEVEPTALHRPLDQLVNFGLLTRLPTPPPDPAEEPEATSPPSGGPGGPYAVTHALIHTYARHHLPVDDATAARLIAVYTALAKAASKKGLPGYRLLDPERPHLLRLIDACAERGDWIGAKLLVWAVDNYLDMQGYALQRQEVLQAGLAAVQQLGDRHDEEALLGNLGNTYADLGQMEQAINYLQQALLIAQEVGDRQGQATHLGNLGIIYRNLGQADKAIDSYEQTLLIAQQISDQRSLLAALGNLGTAYLTLRQFERAIDYYQQALAIAQEIGDRRTQGTLLGNLGNTYADLGQVEQAIDYYQQALAIAQEIGDRRTQETLLGNLGNTYADLDQMEQAIDFYQQALAIAQEIDTPRTQEALLGSLGHAYRNLEQFKRAIDSYQQALDIAQEIGDRQREATHLGNLGAAYLNLNQVEQAIDYLQQALAIAQETGDPQREAALLGNLGVAYADLGEVDKAIDFYQQALAIAQEIDTPRTQGVLLGSLGHAYRNLEQFKRAIDYYQQALAIHREIGDRQAEASRLGNLGNAYYSLGQLDQAIDHYQQALTIDREIGYRQGQAADLNNLGLAYRALGQVDQAIDHYQQALAINREIGYRQGQAIQLNNLGIAYRALGQIDQARDYLTQALHIYEAIKSPAADRVRRRLANLPPAQD